MSIVRKLCRLVADRLPLRIIGREDEPYLERYYLLGKEPAYFGVPIKERLGFLPTVFLHRFVRSDQDDELHNHPWDNSLSFILAGGYIEERRTAWCEVISRTVMPFTFNRIRESDFHRVELIERDAWTIFITGKKMQSWGFWSRTTGEFLNWREHLARKGHPQADLPKGEDDATY